MTEIANRPIHQNRTTTLLADIPGLEKGRNSTIVSVATPAKKSRIFHGVLTDHHPFDMSLPKDAHYLAIHQ